MKAKNKLLLISTFSIFLALIFGATIPQQAWAREAIQFSHRLTSPDPIEGGVQETKKVIVDGVSLSIENSILPASANFTTSAPDAAIQTANAAVWNPFQEVTIIAVPFGKMITGDYSQMSMPGVAEIYRSALLKYRSNLGLVLAKSPLARIFGQQVSGSASVVKVNVDATAAKPVLIVEWVIESGERLWIVRVSRELNAVRTNPREISNSDYLDFNLEINSDSLSQPSTLLSTTKDLINAFDGFSLNIANDPVALADLPQPYWWNGYNCDWNWYNSQTGVQAITLGAVYLGMPACGPRPSYGGPNPGPVRIFPGGHREYEWQCVELSMRYLYLAYGINAYQANGNQVVANYTGSRLQKISNGTVGAAPQAGDVLSYGPTDPNGHTSVVMSSSVDGNGNGNITVIEQNYSLGGSTTLPVSNWRVAGNPYTVSSWLHDPNSTGCPNGSSTLRNNVNSGPPIHPPGSILKAATDTKIYLIDSEGRKRWITSPSVLANLYNQSNSNFTNWTITVGQDELDQYETGADISSPLPGNGKSYPDGKIIRRSTGGEISVVSGGGLQRGFVDFNRLQTLGFATCNIVTIPDTDYDSYKPGGQAGTVVDAMPLLTASLRLYNIGSVGQQIRGEFTIQNVGYNSVALDKLLIGGRLNGQIADFPYDSGITLGPGQSYSYSRFFTPTAAGTYIFYVAYQEQNGHWTIAVPANPGVIRTETVTINNQPQLISVSVTSNPAGRSFSVDGINYTATQSFNWTSGSNHTIATSSPQSETAGTRYVWSNWSDGGAISHTVAPTSNTTYTANFTTQYQITTSANPSNGGTVSPSSGNWYNAGTTVTLQASPNPGYTFNGWTGSGTCAYSGSANPVSLSMNCAATQTANFTQNSIPVTVSTNPSGRSFSVDGITYTSSQVFNWTPGSPHTISTTSPQSGGAGIQYLFSNWSDGGAITHQVSPTSTTTYTANFTTQYQLTTAVSPPGGGTVTPSSGGWYNAGAQVSLQASPNSGYTFAGWTGAGSCSYSGPNNPATISMNCPATETANFSQSSIPVIVNTSPAGRSFSVDGTNYTGTQTFNWIPNSAHTISTTSPQSGGPGIQYVFTGWNDGGQISHIVAPTSSTTYTANFSTQYFLTMNPGTSGSVSPGSGWKDAGQNVQISAAANGGYTFSGWSGVGTGAYSGSANPASVTMGGPITETASFNQTQNATIQFSSPTFSVNENGALATITVTRSNNVGLASVFYSTSDGTATGGLDYAPAPPGSSVNFDFGMTTALITIQIYDDALVEGSETFNLTLSGPSPGYSIGSPGAATVTIIDNDSSNPRRASFDFDGDGKTDVSVYRPGAAAEWWIWKSSNNGLIYKQFGSTGDLPVPADYTGDGKSDIAVFRPSTNTWNILRSEDDTISPTQFGTTGDIPAPADFDGDGKADPAIFRGSTGTWWFSSSANGGQHRAIQFGQAGDKPVPADYDGDGTADFAIYRPNGLTGGEWWILRSTAGVLAVSFGSANDKTVVGDYTGDGKADCAFFRPSNGIWYVLRSDDFSFYGFPWGLSTDQPVPGDYDGDGKTDAAVFRQPGAQWYVNRSTGGVTSLSFGTTGDVPIPGVYVR